MRAALSFRLLELPYDPLPYLAQQTAPWVRYNVETDLHVKPASSAAARSLREDILKNPRVETIISECLNWPGPPIKRHSDSGHTLHKIAFLADLGLTADEPPIRLITDRVLSHRSEEGALESSLQIPRAFGGSGEEALAWITCDSPTLIYSLLRFGVTNSFVDTALDHILSLVRDNGLPCRSSVPGFYGPGRKDEHCPYANLILLKALAYAPGLKDSWEAERCIEAQLRHWENRAGKKIFMFGIGTNFAKVKYPMVWYDILHVADVLSRFDAALEDQRFTEMLSLLPAKQTEEGGFTPESIYVPWKGWSWGQKKTPCPWITYKVASIFKRLD